MKIDELTIKDSVLIAIGNNVMNINDVSNELKFGYHDSRNLTNKQISNAIYSLCKDGLAMTHFKHANGEMASYVLTDAGYARYKYFEQHDESFKDDEDNEDDDSYSNLNEIEDEIDDEVTPSWKTGYDAAMQAYAAAMKAYEIAMKQII